MRPAAVRVLVLLVAFALVLATGCQGEQRARPAAQPSDPATATTPDDVTPDRTGPTSPVPGPEGDLLHPPTRAADGPARPDGVPSPTTPPRPTPSTTSPPSPTSSPPPTPTASPSPTAGASLPASLRGTEWVRIPTSQKVVALTFDAGANADGVDAILRTLAATDTPATFFLTGGFVDRFPDTAARIARAHPVGNHSQTHPAFTELADAEVREEVAAAERRIRQVTGTTPAPLFRFPFGDRDARTIRLVNELGYGSIRWTVDTLGWQGTSGGRSASSVADRVLSTATPGQIVLLHVGSHPTDRSTLDADALPTIVRELRARGYRFVTLREAIAIAG